MFECGLQEEAHSLSLSLALPLSSFLSIGHHRKCHFYITVCLWAQKIYTDAEKGREVMNIYENFTKVKTVRHSFGLNRRICFIEPWLIASVLPAVGGFG